MSRFGRVDRRIQYEDTYQGHRFTAIGPDYKANTKLDEEYNSKRNPYLQKGQQTPNKSPSIMDETRPWLSA